MKISSGGIGTVATSQACNAKSAYPYQWAWNAVGTDLSSMNINDVIYVQSNSTVVPHQYGIKHSPGESETGTNVSLKYMDEGGTPPGGNRSGPLNAVDLGTAPYVHLVVDLLSSGGFGQYIVDHFLDGHLGIDSGDPPGGWTDGMFQYADSGTWGDTKSVTGGVAIFPHSLNSNTYILVWNPRDQEHKQGSPGWGPDTSDPLTGKFPIFLEFYPGGTFDASTDNYLIIMGWVIADRILTDIPLPIRTHMG